MATYCTVYRKFSLVPTEVLDQLEKTGYQRLEGYMRQLIYDYRKNYKNRRLLHRRSLRAKDRYVAITRTMEEPQQIVSWSVLDDAGEIHAWTEPKYRGHGYAQYTIANMLAAMPALRRKKVKMSDKYFPHLLHVARFLHRLGLADTVRFNADLTMEKAA